MERRFKPGFKMTPDPAKRCAAPSSSMRAGWPASMPASFPTPPAAMHGARRRRTIFGALAAAVFAGPVGGTHAASPGGAQAKPGQQRRPHKHPRRRPYQRPRHSSPKHPQLRGQRPACSEKKPSAAIRPAASPARREKNFGRRTQAQRSCSAHCAVVRLRATGEQRSSDERRRGGRPACIAQFGCPGDFTGRARRVPARRRCRRRSRRGKRPARFGDRCRRARSKRPHRIDARDHERTC